jgi:hypothetical protein
MGICHWSFLPQSPVETLDIGMSGASTPSALRFLTHDVVKKTPLCWALYPDICMTNRNCNTSEISILIFMSGTLTYSRSYLMLIRDCNYEMNESHPSPRASKRRPGKTA